MAKDRFVIAQQNQGGGTANLGNVTIPWLKGGIATTMDPGFFYVNLDENGDVTQGLDPIDLPFGLLMNAPMADVRIYFSASRRNYLFSGGNWYKFKTEYD